MYCAIKVIINLLGITIEISLVDKNKLKNKTVGVFPELFGCNPGGPNNSLVKHQLLEAHSCGSR